MAQLANASVRAPGKRAILLADTSVSVAAGERLLVIGPSGSGKSTLLQAVTGVIPFSQNLAFEGQVGLNGTDVTGLSVAERSRWVGMVAQDPAAAVCLAHVMHEVALPLENHAVPRAEISARIDQALAQADAGALRERATETLSGGELQRVALAAALAPRPGVLLLDEPTSMLDPTGVRAVRRAISTAAAQGGTAVVLVEHRLDEFAGADGTNGLPERTLILDEGGQTVACGPTSEILASHAVRLHEVGCWLPLETEILAISGEEGGLSSGAVRAWLRKQAQGCAPSPGQGEPLLSARDMAVGHRMLHSSRSRPHKKREKRAVETILAGVDFTVHAGEIVALLGANGSGKSSLLHTLAGLLLPLAGSVAGSRPSMVFQHPELQFLAHRVRDEIAVGLPGNHSDIAAIVDRQLHRYRLEHVADLDPYRLSGGEKRRLSLAAMLAHDSRRVLLADEPAFGLDRRDTVAVAGIFRDEASRGRAIMFSSHDLRFVTTVADRVIVLADGAVVADGPTSIVLQDAQVLQRAGLELPPLVAWLLAESDSAGAVHALWQLYMAGATDALMAS
ncbi:MAG: ABC transporter ATP-binding protein [Microbacterium sp.]|uniref:ABC transporter ATP-binding protein n=1 Tax=Microbacterium sp. TaxID=51671 RepID=UPI003F99D357